MTNLIIIALLVLAVVVLAGWALILKGKEDILARKEVAMEEQKQKLVHETDILIAESESLKTQIKEMAPLFNSATEITASYTVTESDELKYSTEEAVKRAAIKSMRFAIANDISNKFEPEVIQDGRTKYVYKFKVVQI